MYTYLGLRDDLEASEGARRFTLESSRGRTPLGHTRRVHRRDPAVDDVRRRYRETVGRLIHRIAETEGLGPVSSLSIRPRMSRLPAIEQATETRSSARMESQTNTSTSGRSRSATGASSGSWLQRHRRASCCGFPLRVRLSTVLDVACCRLGRSGRTDWQIRVVASDCEHCSHATAEAD